MKVLRVIFIISFLIFNCQFLIGQIAINTDGSIPNASAMLDVTSTDKGILIPRMTTSERNAISNPATGLLVYDTDENSFWYYANTAWNEISASQFTSLSDADDDTKIQVEESADEDIIRFDLGGTEFMRLNNGRVEIVNTGQSVFIGESAGINDDFSDNRNVFIGYESANSSTSGYENAFLGYQSGYSNTTGSLNAFMGFQSGYANTTGGLNTFVGYESGAANTTGYHNTFLGFQSGYANTTADGNTFIGYKSGAANTTGEENTFLGYDSGLSNSTGYENTFIGYRSGRINTIGSENTFLGYDSGRLNTEGKENTFLGTESGYWNETGNHNVMIGYRAGLLNVEGNSSIFLGYEAGHNETGSNKLYIENSSSSSPLIYGEFDNDYLKINGQLAVTDTLSLSSAIIVNGKDLANTGFISENNITYAINNDDDFVVGADSLNWGNGTEPKLFFDKSKGAFRTGRAFNSNWDEDNIGDYSVAWGYGSKASGDYATAWGLSSATDDFATAWGHDNSASGSASTVWGDDNSATGSTSTVWGYDNSASGARATAWGYDNVASGRNSTIWGEGSEAFSYAETVLGTYSTNYTGFNATSFVSDDRLFVIGNGTSSSNRSDAMIVYKSGNTEINGQLSISDTLNLSSALMVNGKDLANTAFTSESGITAATNNDDDFLFGADALDYGGSGTEYKLFFDKSKGAFRVGSTFNNNWNESNLGDYSTAFGRDTKANGDYATALGSSTVASGENSTALGYGTVAYSYGETVIGTINTSYTPLGGNNGINAADRLFVIGNGSPAGGASDAMIVYKSGDTEINGNLTISDSLSVTGEATFNEQVYIKKEVGGSENYALTLENLNNAPNGFNNGLQIRAGQKDANYNALKSAYLIQFETPDSTEIGSIRQDAGNSISFNTTSDIRLKTNIQPTEYSLADILNIQVRDYHYKSDANQTPQTGFLAQQLNEVYPIAVTEGGEDAKTNPWTVDYSKLTPLLVKGIQDQQQIIEQQNARIQQLEQQMTKINELEAKLEALLK